MSAPLLDAQGSICNPLTGCAIPWPTTVQHMLLRLEPGHGAGPLLLTKLSLFRLRRNVGVSEIKTKNAPRPRIQNVVRRRFRHPPCLKWRRPTSYGAPLRHWFFGLPAPSLLPDPPFELAVGADAGLGDEEHLLLHPRPRVSRAHDFPLSGPTERTDVTTDRRTTRREHKTKHMKRPLDTFLSSQYCFCRLPHWPTSSTTTS